MSSERIQIHIKYLYPEPEACFGNKCVYVQKVIFFCSF